MKKINFSLILVFALVAAISFTSCSKKSVTGNWRCDLASAIADDPTFKNAKGDWILSFKDDKSSEMKIKGTMVLADDNGQEDFSMDIDVTITGTYEYKDGAINYDWEKVANVTVSNIQVTPEEEDGLDEQDMSIEDVESMMSEKMKELMTAKLGKTSEEVISLSDTELVINEKGKQYTFKKQ